jgi:hypothetical protein
MSLGRGTPGKFFYDLLPDSNSGHIKNAGVEDRYQSSLLIRMDVNPCNGWDSFDRIADT